MKRIIVLVGALWSLGAVAQEIGTELPPEPPPPPPSYDPPPSRPVAQAAPAVPAEPQKVPGPRAGAFGIRASLLGNNVPSPLPPGVGGLFVGGGTPTVGLRYLASDSLALNFDLGAAASFGNDTLFGFGLGFGVDAFLGSADKALRPFVGGGIGLGAPLTDDLSPLSLRIQAGFGAEYWFSDHFSLAGSVMLGIPVGDLSDVEQITFGLFQPGLSANFYF